MAEPTQSKPVETVTLAIDGQTVTVPKGTTILTAAEQLGTRVPHYCYHAGLSAPAMCRLCLVEVEKAPKLQPACTTTVAEGQVVHTQSEKALAMRRGVLEFYLQNHPLDCPICDQSGECKLQDYAHAEGRFHGRGKEPKRVFGRDDFGGDVLFYGDRCVMCTRCVRFMTEVEQDPRLTVVERGDRAIIDTFFDEGLEGTHFHGNIVDICPVGALLSKDFLFKQRAWDLDHTPSVCPSCSQGCNVELHTRDNLVQRLKPRQNLDVNAHWMCDYGRLNYEWINRGDRIEVPLVRGEQGTRATGWREALGALLARLEVGPVKAVVSPKLSNEDLGAVRALVDSLGGGEIVYRSERAPNELPLKGFPKLVRRRDLAPNVNGAQLLEMKRVGSDDCTGGLEAAAAHPGVLLVIGDDLADQPTSFGRQAQLYVFMGTHPAPAAEHAHFVLPLSTFAEQEGTFTNFENRVQRFWPALEAPGAARPAWLVLRALLAERAGGDPPTRAETAFEAIPAFGGLTYEQVGTRGARVGGAPQTAGVAPRGGLSVDAFFLISSSLKVTAVFTVMMVAVAYTTLAERKLSAWLQDRIGPNRVGPLGLLQPIADGIKNILKEETLPGTASKLFFVLGPMLSVMPALVIFAVVPFAAPLPTTWGVVPMIVADVPIGILYVMALSSLGVYGLVLGGWASNNKFAFLGGLRASAQMVSYEVALGLSLVTVLMLAGNVTLTEVVFQQQRLQFWFIFPLSLAFILFVISAFAETNRLPFDMPEAESELVTGYHTEYSSMKFSMFFIAEYAHLITQSALMATLFLGGWDIPFWGGDDAFLYNGAWIRGFGSDGAPIAADLAWWKTLLTLGAFSLKTGFFVMVFIWVRWTLPRFRYDQVMQLGWKIMLPTALAYVMAIAGAVLTLDEVGVPYGPMYGLALTAVSLVATGIFVFWLDRDRIIGGASTPSRQRLPRRMPMVEERLPAGRAAGRLAP